MTNITQTGGVPKSSVLSQSVQDSGDPEALSAAAVEAFERKEYDQAIRLFEQAHKIDPQPNYLFNIGRVYEDKGDLPNAVKYFQAFLNEPGIDLTSRQSVNERLKVLQNSIEASQVNLESEGKCPKPEADTAFTRTEPYETSALGVAGFNAGRYRWAARQFKSEFRKADGEDKNPYDLFNAALSYEMAGRDLAAARLYKRFIVNPDIRSEDRDNAVNRLNELKNQRR